MLKKMPHLPPIPGALRTTIFPAALKLTLPPPFTVSGGAPDCAAVFDRAGNVPRHGATN
jgi:hypothetical protein